MFKHIIGVFFPATSVEDRRMNQFYKEWDRARTDAAMFGPSHVEEIDAIFSRNV